jgi:hypothetical protein
MDTADALDPQLVITAVRAPVIFAQWHRQLQAGFPRPRRNLDRSPKVFAVFCPGASSNSRNTKTSTRGTNNSNVAHPDQPTSCSLDTAARRTTTELTNTTRPSGRCIGPFTKSGFLSPWLKAIIDRMTDPTATGAAHQNKNSSLPIRLENMILFASCLEWSSRRAPTG